MPIGVEDFKNLSPRNRLLIVLGICLLIGYFYYMYFFQGVFEKRTTLNAKLTEMQQQIAVKEKVAAQKGQYFREIHSLQESFKLALQKLPNAREIAGLLSSVVLSGQEAGVNFLLFEPKPPDRKPAAPPAKPAAGAKGPPAQSPAGDTFYEEIPIKVQMNGTFHGTVSFFAKIAKLPRIINIENITMGEAKDVRGQRIVKTDCTVKTYMFVDKKP